MPSVKFGQRQVANEVRSRLGDFLADSDDRRTNTVELDDSVPESFVQRVQEEAADSRQAEAQKAGQASLTDRERKEIDFAKDGVNVPFARSVKGIANTEGVEDWLQFADLDLTVDENRNVLERAAREERGQRGGGRSKERRQLQKGQQAKRQRRQQAEGAKQPAFGGDAEAAQFLREEQRFEDDLFDISLRGSGPSGNDYERLKDAHNDRSKQAQRVDERRSAEVTRDPLRWAQNKSTLDFPGIDTVDPEGLHSQRSDRAQRKDEKEQAPIADNREQWARNPDQYDWPGVDTKTRSSLPMDDLRSRAEAMQSAKQDALYRNEPMSKADELQAKARSEGVSFDPGLDMQQPESQEPGSSALGVPEGTFAWGQDSDMAFISAGEDRSRDPFDMSQDGGLLADGRDRQGSLDVGLDAGATRDREGEIAGSAGFADRRDELQPDDDNSQQSGLFEMEPEVGDGQADLFGGNATQSSGGEYR